MTAPSKETGGFEFQDCDEDSADDAFYAAVLMADYGCTYAQALQMLQPMDAMLAERAK